MNKIIIDSNINNISIESNDDYDIEIVSGNDIELNIDVLDDIRASIFIHSINKNINGIINYSLGVNSDLTINKFSFNDNSIMEENIYLNGKYSTIRYNFSCIASNINKYKIRVYHNNSNVYSYISNKCIGNDGSEIVFDIDSILDKGNTSCVMDQTSKVMCFGDVKAKIRPNMYIEEEDVEARHGSVIGRFSDDDIFYVMSRGIGYREAIVLLVKGFILSNLSLDDERIKDIVDIIDNNYK